MRLILFTLAITLCSVFLECRKTALPPPDEGTVVGFNNGACPICGGFYLNLSNDTVQNANTFYVLSYADTVSSEVDSLRAQYARNLKPIPVFVSCQPLSKIEPGAPSNWLRVTSIGPR